MTRKEDLTLAKPLLNPHLIKENTRLHALQHPAAGPTMGGACLFDPLAPKAQNRTSGLLQSLEWPQAGALDLGKKKDADI